MSYNEAFQDEFYTCCIDQEKSNLMVIKDKHALCEDLKYILSVPDLCDVTFLVGPNQYPVHGLRAILASRSRMFYQVILAKEREVKLKHSYKKHGLFNKLKELRKLFRPKASHKSSKKSLPRKLIVTMEEYKPGVFERLMRYIHCGVVSVDVFAVIGLLIAAEKFELSCLKNACWEFAITCIRPDMVHDLIASANHYSNHRLTKLLLQEIQDISLKQPERLYHNHASTRDLSDCRNKSITTNGLLMRSVL